MLLALFGRRLSFICILSFFGLGLSASTISGNVKDASGALVPGAKIEIIARSVSAIALTSDGEGRFVSPDLHAGIYEVRVSRSGFENLTRQVELGAAAISLDFQLTVAGQRAQTTVSGNGAGHANNDATYQRLRTVGLGVAFNLRPDVTLANDVGSFTFHSGTITFLQPVNGVCTGAVFVGDGELTLAPVTPLDKAELRRRTNGELFREGFSQVVFRFTNATNQKMLQLTNGTATAPSEAARAFSEVRDALRHRREQPQSATEALLTGADIDNVEADILASLYNPERPAFFAAYVRGKKHKDLRFFVREHGGAIPQLDSPEEVALVNYAPGSLDEGVWYAAHRKEEYERASASSSEERKFFAAKRFKIETVIAQGSHMTGVASMELQPVVAGERVMKLHLLPNLRVSRVADGSGQELYYIQESRKADGSFYIIFPKPCEPGKTYRVTVEYAGDNVIHSAGNGSFYIGARESWYPNPNGFGENSIYDLTFRVPRQYALISVGKLEHQSEEDRMAVTHWVTAKPVAIAGFNYGAYRKTRIVDEQTKTALDGYFLTDLPDYLHGNQAVESLAPESMTKYVLRVARAQLELCNYYFGSNGFQQLYVTEQPNFDFGQSWPNLVYLPISAYMDSTQRWMLAGTIDNELTSFVEEVTPHEVSHQWWGHAVGWASYHDQWLSEGFAEFSAGLFVQQGRGPGHEKDYRKFWDRLKQEVIEKQQFGKSANDEGPLWLGSRLASPKNEAATQMIIYPKGAFVLNMLRTLMWSEKGDGSFIEMMHDFVGTHMGQAASTESFKAIVEKHMPKGMDFDGNGKLDWFFDEWVYGTEIPKYDFKCALSPAANGHVKAKMTLTQGEVDPHFAMSVPLYAELEKGQLARFGQFSMRGSGSRTIEVELPFPAKAVVMDPYHEILRR